MATVDPEVMTNCRSTLMPHPAEKVSRVPYALVFVLEMKV
jgi:hypothetical protein